MGIGDAMLLMLGGLLWVGAGFHEWTWRKRLKGCRCAGRIVSSRDEVRSDEAIFYPVVEYEVEGGTRVFTSKHGSSAQPRMGASVQVVLAPGTGEAEILSRSNRWVGTVALAGFGLLVLLSVAFGH